MVLILISTTNTSTNEYNDILVKEMYFNIIDRELLTMVYLVEKRLSFQNNCNKFKSTYFNVKLLSKPLYSCSSIVELCLMTNKHPGVLVITFNKDINDYNKAKN